MFVSRNYLESDLQGRVKLARSRSLFGWGPLRTEARIPVGTEESPGPTDIWAKSVEGRLETPHTPNDPRNFRGAGEGLAASGEPWLSARFPVPAKQFIPKWQSHWLRVAPSSELSPDPT